MIGTYAYLPLIKFLIRCTSTRVRVQTEALSLQCGLGFHTRTKT